MALTLTEAQRLLLGIIASVESGVTTPEDAVEKLETLKIRATVANLTFKADYTLADFQKISGNYISIYESGGEPYTESGYAPGEPDAELPYESSYNY